MCNAVNTAGRENVCFFCGINNLKNFCRINRNVYIGTMILTTAWQDISTVMQMVVWFSITCYCL